MGIPIRLNVGPDGNDSISLDAVSLDVSVDRNVSAFPTPNNILNRMAIDANIPSIEIEIAGILQDDEWASDGISNLDYGDQILMNFASTAPTVNQSWMSPHLSHLDASVTRFHQFLEFQIKASAHPDGINISGSSQTIDVFDRFLDYATEEEAIDDMVGNKLFDKYGRTIGTISGITITADSTGNIVFPSGPPLAGDWNEGPNRHRLATITLSSVSVALDAGDIMHFGVVSALEDVWINKCFALYPNYWKLTGKNPAYTRPASATAIIFKFVGTNSHLSGGSAHPTITNTANSTHVAGTPSSGRHAVIEIPIGGVFAASDNENPASTLALLVKEAIELSSGTRLSVQSKPLYPNLTTSYPTDAFAVEISGGALLITQKYEISSNDNVEINFTPKIFKKPTNTVGSNLIATMFGQPTKQVFTPPNGAIRWDGISRNASSISAEGKQKSAGDKAQDLLGLISNATKGRDLIRGIQIPYDSLITSSGVTGTARNFFLTFGEQSLEDKGSLYNTREASLTLVPGLTGDSMGGEPTESTESSWLQTFKLGGLEEASESLLSFVGNLAKDTFVALKTKPHGNDGGIRIIPEKLHVRYDAGDNYYAFNLKLLASDFVIGV